MLDKATDSLISNLGINYVMSTKVTLVSGILPRTPRPEPDWKSSFLYQCYRESNPESPHQASTV